MTTLCIIDCYSKYDWLFKTNGNFLIVNDIINGSNILLDTPEDIPLFITKALNDGLCQLVDSTSVEALSSYMNYCNLQYIVDPTSMIEYCSGLDHIIFLPISDIPTNDMRSFINKFIKNIEIQFKNKLQIVYLYNTFLLSQFIEEGNAEITPLSLVRYIKHQVNIIDIIKEKLLTTSIPHLMIDDLLYKDTDKKIKTIYKFLSKKCVNVIQPTNNIRMDKTNYQSVIDQLSCTTLATYLR